MGIDYTAKLFYGFPFPEVLMGEDEFEIDEFVATKLELEKSWGEEYREATKDLGIGFIRTSFFDEGRWYVAVEGTYFWSEYDATPIDLPTITEEMLDRHKAGCEKLGIEYQEPKWLLVVSVW